MSNLLHDVLEHTIGGGWGSEEPNEGDIPVNVIRGADFPRVALRDTSLLPLRFEPRAKVLTRALREGDIVLETSGGTRDRPTGRTILVTQGMVDAAVPKIPASFCRLVRVDRTKAFPAFVYYALQSFYLSGGAWGYQNQSTGISNFQFEVFRHRFHLPSFSLPEQLAIADVLGALDDKIAINEIVRSTTWELARAEFAKASLFASEPRVLGELLRLEYGKSLPARAREVGDVRVVGSGGTVGQHSAAIVNQSGVVVGRKGTAGAVHWIDGPHWPIDTTFFATPVAPEISQPYAYFLLESLKLDQMNSDSAVPGLNRTEAEAIKLRVPPAKARTEFTAVATPLIELASQIGRESIVLAELRDTLLPELMSGRLRVKDAEKQIEEVG